MKFDFLNPILLFSFFSTISKPKDRLKKLIHQYLMEQIQYLFPDKITSYFTKEHTACFYKFLKANIAKNGFLYWVLKTSTGFSVKLITCTRSIFTINLSTKIATQQ